MAPLASFTTLPDAELLAQVARLAICERNATAQLIGSLAEFDTRRLYLGQGFSSLFTYCTQVLRLSEHAAYGRIEAARAGRRFPVILDRLADGSITLTTVGLLAAHLTLDNHRELLDAAHHRSKRDVEELVARLRPQPPVPSRVRKLPAQMPIAATAMSPPRTADVAESLSSTSLPTPLPPSPGASRAARTAAVKPLAPELYKVQVTVNRETSCSRTSSGPNLRPQAGRPPDAS